MCLFLSSIGDTIYCLSFSQASVEREAAFHASLELSPTKEKATTFTVNEHPPPPIPQQGQEASRNAPSSAACETRPGFGASVPQDDFEVI